MVEKNTWIGVGRAQCDEQPEPVCPNPILHRVAAGRGSRLWGSRWDSCLVYRDLTSVVDQWRGVTKPSLGRGIRWCVPRRFVASWLPRCAGSLLIRDQIGGFGPNPCFVMLKPGFFCV